MRNLLIAGNWKMNLLTEQACSLVKALKEVAGEVAPVDVVVGPVLTSIPAVVDVAGGSRIQVAAQNVFWEEKGAYTGEVSATMLKDVGVDYVIIGHSERRAMFGETNEGCSKKIKASIRAGLKPILCIGETLDEREADKTFQVLEEQVKGSLAGVGPSEMAEVTLAYEPVWAIGTGRTASPEQAQEAHAHIRSILREMFGIAVADATRIQYGGSMKPENAESLLSLPDVDGGLIGGASLKADSFSNILGIAAQVLEKKGKD